MKKNIKIIISILLILLLLLVVFTYRDRISLLLSANLNKTLLNNNIGLSASVIDSIKSGDKKVIDLGKRVDAREQGSYYASLPSVIKDEEGGMHTYYCSSGEDFNNLYAPDWRLDTKTATDKIRYQYSDDGGETWSDAVAVIESYVNSDGSQIVEQSACGNSVIEFEGDYYIYFEFYTPPTNVLSIGVAKSSKPEGPFKVLTEDGWKEIPTESEWKPVIRPYALTVPGSEDDLMKYKSHSGSFENGYYGAGIPRALVVGDEIYLYYVDDTDYTYYENTGIYLEPAETIPYQKLAISDDPIEFDEYDRNENAINPGQGKWQVFPKFDINKNKFVAYYLTKTKELFIKESKNGVDWENPESVTSIPDYFNVSLINDVKQDENIEIADTLFAASDFEGVIDSDSDIDMFYQKEYLLPDGPKGWKDAPNFNWYYGGRDLYQLKLTNNRYYNYGDDGVCYDTNRNGNCDIFDLDGDGGIDAWDSSDKGTPNMWDTNGDGEVDCFDTTGDRKCNMGKTPGSDRIDWWKYSNGVCYDTNRNGNCDIFDLDGDGKIDAWNTRDSNVWARPNMWDTDGDGKADAFDTTGDGKANWYR